MPSKTEEYLALAQRTANGLTRYWESWTDYLTTASRLYKYSFADQLMIYAQRPDATACADFDIWNNRMNRYVPRGAKGIALLDESSGLHRSELQGRSWKAKDQVGSHRSVRQEEQEESRGSFAGTSAELHGFHRSCGDSLRR